MIKILKIVLKYLFYAEFELKLIFNIYNDSKWRFNNISVIFTNKNKLLLREASLLFNNKFKKLLNKILFLKTMIRNVKAFYV